MAALKQFSRGQIADQVSIRGEKVKARQFPQRNPAQIVENAVLDFALEGMYGEELQIDGAAAAVVVAEMRDACADGGVDAELFLELAVESLLGCLSRLDFSAGELPLGAEGLVRAALTDEHLVAAQYERSGDGPHCLVLVARVVVHAVSRAVLRFGGSVDARWRRGILVVLFLGHLITRW